MNNLVVEAATPQDRDVIAGFNRAMARETEDKQLDDRRLQQGVEAILADEGKGRYFCARAEGRTVGQMLITFEYSDWRNGWFWWIQSVYVAPDCRRRGVYSALYDHVRNLAMEHKDVCGLRLYVDKSNRTARETYLSLGMTQAHYDMLETEF